jgi:hypothetical protein
MPIALIAIVLGALETAGGAQELILQGIIRSHRYSFITGILGVAGGALLLAAGIALLIRFQLMNIFTQAAANVKSLSLS